jgi:DNA topoisomerase-1
VGYSLVIVESPAKAKTIGKYLGKGFQVKASVGHVKDLPKSKLGVDLDADFKPTYKVITGKKKTITDLRKAADGADEIFLALDPDREGEAIAFHIAEELSKKGKKAPETSADFDDRIRRILFNEITKKAIKEAVQNPKQLDTHLYEAQQARRILDRLVGYQLSPLLWDKVRRGLSAGRVQSVSLRIICERERDIRAFNIEEYWTLHATLEGSEKPIFEAKLAKLDGKKPAIHKEEAAVKLVNGFKTGSFVLNEVIRKERKRKPAPPFITSTLQQEAARKLGFTAKRTMRAAQGLYEGVELEGEGSVGLITYMRTDSTRISDTALQEVRELIREKYGRDSLPEKPNIYKSKKGAQDAHEAVRPTSVHYEPLKIKHQLEKDQYRLYELIWKRFVACQMSNAIMDQTSLVIHVGKAEFRASGSVIKFPGFLAVYQEGRDDEKQEDSETKDQLPDLKEGETLTLHELRPDQHFTEPPPRFTEASLIKELEEKGIGRPSTYAAILSNIVDREYVQKDQNRLVPTDLGFIVNDLLVESFPKVMDVEFTAKLERELDDVEEGALNMVETLRHFYEPFSKNLEHAKVHMKNMKAQEIQTGIQCEKCGSVMVIKWGKRGEFLACSGYPECRQTSEFKRDDAGNVIPLKMEVTGEFCSECASPMVLKKGRYGTFLACSRYPTCKTTRSVNIGVDCPLCGEKVVERRTRKGKIFFGCSGYPKCSFASWDKPVNEPCPECGSSYLVEKTTKKDSQCIACPEKGCQYRKEMSVAD